MAESVEEREAQHGKKMIEVKVRFWTNGLAEDKGNIRPKHAWGSGVVRMASNPSHGIAPKRPVVFNSLAEIPATIEKVLIEHGIRIHPDRRAKKYMA